MGGYVSDGCSAAMRSSGERVRTRRGYRAAKRALDVLFSVCVIVVCFVPSLLLCAAIRLESPGCPIYRQTRVGQIRPDGSIGTFTMYKFRSMVAGADEHLGELLARNEAQGAMFKIRDDPRVTKVGRFIRKHSIDEFPQFVNVLKGDMSLVGPRPPLPRELDGYTERDLQRLAVRPGLTGPWQVSERDIPCFDEMVELDLDYIENCSFLGDIGYIARTPSVMFGKRSGR